MTDRTVHRHPHLTGLLRAVMALGSLHTGAMGLTFLIGVLLARRLGPAGYGIYATAMAFAALAGMITEFGLPSLAMREFATAEAKQSWGEARGLMRWADRLIGGLSLMMLALAIAYVHLSAPTNRPMLGVTMLWAALLIPAVGLEKVRGLALLAMGHPTAGQFPLLILRPGMFALALLGLWIAGRPLSPEQAMACQVFAALVALAVVACLYFRLAPAALRQARPRSRRRLWLRVTLPMGMTEGLRVVQGQLSTSLLALLASSATVGLFRVADSSATACLLPVTVVNVAAAGMFARLHAEGDRARLQQTVTAATVLIVASVAAVTLPLCLAGRPLLALLFGQRFAPAAPALVTLLLGNLAAAMFGPAVVLANMCGLERRVVTSSVAGVLVTAALNLLLVPRMGPVAGALAVAGGLIVLNAVLAQSIRSRIGIDPTIFALRPRRVTAAFRLGRDLLRQRLAHPDRTAPTASR